MIHPCKLLKCRRNKRAVKHRNTGSQKEALHKEEIEVTGYNLFRCLCLDFLGIDGLLVLSDDIMRGLPDL